MAEVLDIVVRQRGARRVAKDIAQIGIAAGTAKTALQKLQITLRTTNSAFKGAGSAAAGYTAKLKATTAATTAANTKLMSTRAALIGIGTGAAIAGTALIAGFLRPLQAATQSAADFQTAINLTGVLTKTDRTSQAFKDLESTARELGLTTQFTAVQAAEGLSFLALAGFNARDAIASIGPTTTIAAAANIDLGRAAEITTNILKGFGQEVRDLPKAVDILASTFTSSNVDIEDLAKTFEAVAPVMVEFGQSFADAAALTGKLGDAGIQSEKTGVALRRILINLNQDAERANSVLRRVGISIRDDVSGNMRPLIEIFQDMGAAGLSASELIGLLGARALASGGVIKRASDILRVFSTQLEEDVGRGAVVAAARLFGFNGAALKLASAIDALGRAIVDAGLLDAFTNMADKLTDIVRSLARMNPAVLTTIGVLATFLAVAGALLVPIGLISIGIGAIGGALKGVSFGFIIKGFLRLGALFNPISAGIAIAVTAFLLIKDIEFELGGETLTLGAIIQATFNAAIRQFKRFAKFAKETFGKVKKFILDAVVDLKLFGKNVATLLPSFNSFAVAVLSTFRIIDTVIEVVLRAIGTSVVNFGSFIVDFASKLPAAIKAQFDGDEATSAGSVLGTVVVSGFLDSFDGLGVKISDAIKKELKFSQKIVDDFVKTSVIQEAVAITLGKTVTPEKEGPASDLGGGGTKDDLFVGPQRESPAQLAARESVDRLRATFEQGVDTTLRLAAALRVLTNAEQIHAVAAGTTDEVYQRLRTTIGEDFVAAVDPVAAIVKQNREEQELLNFAVENFGIASEQAAFLQELLGEQFQERLLQSEAYRQSLVGIQAAQLGVTEGLKEFALVGKTQFDVIKGATNELAGVITNSLTAALRDGEFSFKEFALTVVQSIQAILVKLLIQILLQTILNSLTGGSTGIPLLGIAGTGSSTPALAEGGNIGPQQTGQAFIVGEKGPELFVPQSSGEVIPNAATTAMMGGAGAAPPQVNVQVINVDDQAGVPEAMSTREGEEVILNIIQKNRNKLSEIL